MALIFSVALCVRLMLLMILYTPSIAYTGEAERIARSLAELGQFAGAYSVPTGPTAHCGPFYPSLLSLVYRLFGAESASAEAVRVGLLIAANSTVAALLPLVASRLALPFRVALAAGLASALIPMHRTAEILHAWDEPYAAIGLMLAVLLLASWSPLRQRPSHYALWYGFLWGVLLHISVTSLPVFIGFAFAAVINAKQQVWPELRRWAIVLATAALILLPWTIRNRVQLGGWLLVRSNFGLELRISNNDRAGATNLDTVNSGLYTETHPADNVREAERLRPFAGEQVGDCLTRREGARGGRAILARAARWRSLGRRGARRDEAHRHKQYEAQHKRTGRRSR
jgi:hypothetical protein